MKCLKPFGLLLVATAAAACLGIGTASATVLCKTEANPCGSHQEAGAAFNASIDPGTSAVEIVFANGTEAVTETCVQVSIGGELESTTSSGTEPVTIDVENGFSKSSCVGGGFFKGFGPDWVTKLAIDHIPGTNDGTVTATGPPLTYLKFGFHCVYEGGTHAGTLTGGNPATLKLRTTIDLVKGGGPFCPSKLNGWEASYVVTSPSPLYVAEE